MTSWSRQAPSLPTPGKTGAFASHPTTCHRHRQGRWELIQNPRRNVAVRSLDFRLRDEPVGRYPRKKSRQAKRPCLSISAIHIGKSSPTTMKSSSKIFAERRQAASARVTEPVLEQMTLLFSLYNYAESLLLLYGVVLKLTYKPTRGFRTCKALSPSSPNFYPLCRNPCFSSYLRIIDLNARLGHSLRGVISSTCCTLSWPDAKACGTESWA